MHIGLRPQLKARPSLYDLIRNRHIESLSVRGLDSFTKELPHKLPPLPPSPTHFSSPPPTPVQVTTQLESAQKPVKKMAPRKETAKDADGEEQYGASQ